MQKIECFKLKSGYHYNVYRKKSNVYYGGASYEKIDLEHTEFVVGYEHSAIQKNLFLPNNIVKKIDPNIKSVHFIPGTVFSRQLFRQMYPHLSVKRSTDSADLIIYDDTESKKRYYVHSPSVYLKVENHDTPFCIENNLYEAIRDRSTTFTVLNGYDFIKNPLRSQALVATAINVYSEQTYNKYLDYQHNKPYIHVADVFAKGETDLRKEKISLEDAFNIYQQVTNDNKDIQKTGIDILTGLDPNVYLPLQLFLLNLSDKSIQTQRIKIFREYIDKNNIGLLNLYYYGSHRGNTQSCTVSSVKNVVEQLDKDVFTKAMDYSLLFDLINTKLKDQLIITGLNDNYKNHLSLKNPEIECTHPKVLESNKINGRPSSNNEPAVEIYPAAPIAQHLSSESSISEFLL